LHCAQTDRQTNKQTNDGENITLPSSGGDHYYTTDEIASFISIDIITFRVRRSRDEMYSGHGRLCLCLSAPHRISTLGTTARTGCKLDEW